MKRSMEQLLSQTWPTRDAAVKELKRNGFPDRGEDYEIAVSGNGLWQINTFSDVVIGKPKTAKPVEAKAPAAQQLSIRPTPAKPAAKGKKPTKGKPAVVAPTVGEEPPERDDTRVQEPAPEPAPPSGNNLAALPTDAGPYSLAVRAAHVVQDSAVMRALAVSRALGVPCDVLGPDGQILRSVDNAAKGRAERPKRTGGRVAGGESKQGRAIALLTRPQGATDDELQAVTGWPIARRHINRFAQIAKATIEPLGDKKWKLIKPA